VTPKATSESQINTSGRNTQAVLEVILWTVAADGGEGLKDEAEQLE